MSLISSFQNSIIKKGLTIAVSLSVIGTSLSYAEAYVKPDDVENTYDLTHYSKAFLLSDVDGNYSVFSYNATQSLGIASLTKLMTLSIVLDEIENGNLSLDHMVTISAHALSQDGNGLKLHLGEQISVDDLIHGMLICSSNDAAVALAEEVAGSESAFVAKMNQKANELGLKSVSFVNASGLTDYDEAQKPLPKQNKMNSKDLLTLSQMLIKDYPELLEITDQENWTMASKQIDKKNTNALLETIPEVNGFKTGFTYYAGYCQVTTAKLNFGKANTGVIDQLTHQSNSVSAEKEIISIVLGASSKYRKNNISSTLIQYAINNCELYALTDENMPIYVDQVNLPLNYGIFPSKTISIAYPNSSNIKYAIVYNPHLELNAQNISQQSAGKIIFYDDAHYILSVDLILKELSHY